MRALSAERASLEQEVEQLRRWSKEIAGEQQRRHVAALDKQRDQLGQAPHLQRQEYERTLSMVRSECATRVSTLEEERDCEVAQLKAYAESSTVQLRAEADNMQRWLVKERREWASAEKKLRARHDDRMDEIRVYYLDRLSMLGKEYEARLSTFHASIGQAETEADIRMENQAAAHRAFVAALEVRLAREEAARSAAITAAMRTSLSEMQLELDHCMGVIAFHEKRHATTLTSLRQAVRTRRAAVDRLRAESAQALAAMCAESTSTIEALRIKAEADTKAATAKHEGILQALRDEHTAIVAKRDLKIATLSDDSSSAVAKLVEKGEKMQVDFEAKHKDTAAQHAAELQALRDAHAAEAAEYEAKIAQAKADGVSELAALQSVRKGDVDRITAAAQKEYEELKCEVEDLRYELDKEREERADEKERLEVKLKTEQEARQEDQTRLKDEQTRLMDEHAAAAADFEAKLQVQRELRGKNLDESTQQLAQQTADAADRLAAQAAAHKAAQEGALSALESKLTRENAATMAATVGALGESLNDLEVTLEDELLKSRKLVAAMRVQAEKRAKAQGAQMVQLKREATARLITLARSIRSAEVEAAAHRAEGAAERARLCEENDGKLQAAAEVLARSKEILHEDRAKQKAALAERDQLLSAFRPALKELLPPVPTDGVIRVYLSHADGLRAGDLNGLSDPYIVLSYGGKKEKSPTVKQTLNPIFDWQFLFDVASIGDALSEDMLIEAWDEDNVTHSDKLGSGSLELKDHLIALEGGQRVECSTTLEYKPLVGKPVVAGKVYFTLTWEAKSDAYSGVRQVLAEQHESAVVYGAINF